MLAPLCIFLKFSFDEIIGQSIQIIFVQQKITKLAMCKLTLYTTTHAHSHKLANLTNKANFILIDCILLTRFTHYKFEHQRTNLQWAKLIEETTL